MPPAPTIEETKPRQNWLARSHCRGGISPGSSPASHIDEVAWRPHWLLVVIGAVGCSQFHLTTAISSSFKSSPTSGMATRTRFPALRHRMVQNRIASWLAVPVSPRMVRRLTPSRSGNPAMLPVEPSAQVGLMPS